MHPVLSFFGFEIAAYSFFLLLALAVTVFGSYFYAVYRGFKKSDVVLMVLGMAVTAFLGARVLNLFVNWEWYMNDFTRFFAFSSRGFSLYGGILLAVAAGGVIGLIRRIDLLKFADSVTPFLGLGIVIMRIGCFLNGCCFGKETNLPWGVKFPYASHAHTHQVNDSFMGFLSISPVHPTQIYELLAALLGVICALFIIRKGKPAGTAFLMCGIYFSAFRLFNMQLRELPYSDEIIYLWYPLIYLSVILVCGLLLARIYVKSDS